MVGLIASARAAGQAEKQKNMDQVKSSAGIVQVHDEAGQFGRPA